LLRTFGSLEALKRADAAEIAAKVPGIGLIVARKIESSLHKS